MSRRFAKTLLAAAFVTIVISVPIAQGIIDVKVEEEEQPLALDVLHRAPTEKNLRDYEQQLEESSYFEQTLRPLFQLARYELWRDMGEKALRGRDGWTYYHPGVRYLTEPYFRDGELGPGDDPIAAIVDFAKELRRRGLELLVVVIPGKASIHPEHLVAGMQPSKELHRHARRFSAELRAANIPHVDLHRPLSRARLRGATLYMASDTHWNGLGIRIAARQIARWVKRRPWYAKLARTRYRRERTVVAREGDIPTMTRIPRRERLFPKERAVCYRVYHPRGDVYEDDVSSPVMLLGDSFSRVFQTDEPRGAGLIANLAYELQLPLSSIVNDGGASTLVRQQLARDPAQLADKALVIWTFVERDIRFGVRGWQLVKL